MRQGVPLLEWAEGIAPTAFSLCLTVGYHLATERRMWTASLLKELRLDRPYYSSHLQLL